MKKLLEYIIKNIVGREDFEVEEKEEEGLMSLNVVANPEYVGLIIGKQGKTIKAIRNLVKVLAVLEGKSVNISVTERVGAAKSAS
ncbi:KH domain-containing protein [Candidatus Woesebacteria bacterium]|nr:KH domain-containing protein [Candidatus Woesebacteria bacterium]